MSDAVGSTPGLTSSLLQGTTAAASPAPSANKTITQDQFLQLFVAQLQNQDPLSPMDPDQLTAQLATFSSLEQLTGINTRLDTLNATTKDSTTSALLSLIGKQVSFDGSQLAVKSGHAPKVTYQLDQPADRVTATVTAADGTVVRVVELGKQQPGNQTFQFDGKNAVGLPLADGTYSLAIATSNTGSKTPTSLSLLAQGTVDGVDLSAQTPALLVGGAEVTLDQVREVQQPSTGS
jgi:flagellar basal-body rod modification protein FlgD